MQQQTYSSSIKVPLVVLGVDLGFAHTGFAVIKYQGGGYTCANIGHAQTKRATKKELKHTRVASDDVRRVREISDLFIQLLAQYEPHAVAVEAYRVVNIPAKGGAKGWQGVGSNAWKTAMVYGMVMGVCFSRNIPIFPFLPNDLKRAFNLGGDVSKQAIEKTLVQKITGLGNFLSTISKTHREHIADAAGHAVLAMEEIAKLKKMGAF